MKERFSENSLPQHKEIRAAAILMNDLCESFIDATDKLVFCGICGGLYKSLSLRSHHYKVHEGKSLIEQCFDLSSFVTEKGPPIFHDLKKFLITDISDGMLMEEYSVFKKYFVKESKQLRRYLAKKFKTCPRLRGSWYSGSLRFQPAKQFVKLRLQDGSIPSPFH